MNWSMPVCISSRASCDMIDYDMINYIISYDWLYNSRYDWGYDWLFNSKNLCNGRNKAVLLNLLKKLTQECVFSINNRLIKQIDGCPMGGPISVVFSDIYVCKMEEDIVYYISIIKYY